MAATIVPSPTDTTLGHRSRTAGGALAALAWTEPTTAPDHSPTRPHRRRHPHLRVIEGGRSPRSMTRVYRRRRMVAGLLAIAVALVVVVGATAAWSALRAATAPTSVASATVAASASGGGTLVVVQDGDTYTAIARRLQPEGDVRGLVDRLAAAHGPGTLLAGDRFEVVLGDG